eukprot:4201105-Amphidinium_carterae.1
MTVSIVVQVLIDIIPRSPARPLCRHAPAYRSHPFLWQNKRQPKHLAKVFFHQIASKHVNIRNEIPKRIHANALHRSSAHSRPSLVSTMVCRLPQATCHNSALNVGDSRS